MIIVPFFGSILKRSPKQYTYKQVKKNFDKILFATYDEKHEMIFDLEKSDDFVRFSYRDEKYKIEKYEFNRFQEDLKLKYFGHELKKFQIKSKFTKGWEEKDLLDEKKHMDVIYYEYIPDLVKRCKELSQETFVLF